jgi:hypothetical protein
VSFERLTTLGPEHGENHKKETIHNAIHDEEGKMISGTLKSGANPTSPDTRTFKTLSACLDFLKGLMAKTEENPDVVSAFCFGFLSHSVVFQCQAAGVLLQVFIPGNLHPGTAEGWYTLVKDAGQHDIGDEDFFTIHFEGDGDRPPPTHFRVLEGEGLWLPRTLLVDKKRASRGFSDLETLSSARVWAPAEQWMNLGLI